jgi:hypothetical protein
VVEYARLDATCWYGVCHSMSETQVETQTPENDRQEPWKNTQTDAERNPGLLHCGVGDGFAFVIGTVMKATVLEPRASWR